MRKSNWRLEEGHSHRTNEHALRGVIVIMSREMQTG